MSISEPKDLKHQHYEWFKKGTDALFLGFPDVSKVYYEKILEADPNYGNPYLFAHYAVLLYDKGKYMESYRMSKKSISLIVASKDSKFHLYRFNDYMCGKSAYALGNYTESLHYFEKVLQLDETDPDLTYEDVQDWIGKCVIEIKKMDKIQTEEDNEDNVLVHISEDDHSSCGAFSVEHHHHHNHNVIIEPFDEEKEKPKIVLEPKKMTMAEKVTESWFQDQDTVTLTIYSKNLKLDQISYDSHPSQKLFSIRIRMYDRSVFNKTWTLSATWRNFPNTVLNAYRLELIFEKYHKFKWDTFEESQSESCASIHTYPTSFPKKTDWSPIEKDAKKLLEEEQKNDGFNGMMRSIYKDADEETRRAMKQSYVQSNGTKLICNPESVQGKDFSKDIQAPEGCELVKF